MSSNQSFMLSIKLLFVLKQNYLPNIQFFSLKLKDIHSFYVGVYMFRAIVLNECPSISGSLNISYPPHNYGTRSANSLIPPFPRVESIRLNYEHQFCKIWNGIPDHVKTCSNVRSFKREFKNYLFSFY